jgi:hypothetical protein
MSDRAEKGEHQRETIEMQEAPVVAERIPFHLTTIPTMVEYAGEEVTLTPIVCDGAYDQLLQVWMMPDGASRTLTEIVAKKATTCRAVCGTGPLKISEIDIANDD